MHPCELTEEANGWADSGRRREGEEVMHKTFAQRPVPYERPQQLRVVYTHSRAA